eukprot:14268079-Alexandrium_andersonii.AAC.1
MDCDNQKGLREHSLSMRKNKKCYPNLRVSKSDIFEPQAEQTTEDCMKTQESFDGGTDVFSQKPFSNKKPKTFEG